MSGKVARALPPWTTEYLQRCFANEKVCVSFALWIAAAVLWIVADFLLLYRHLRTKGKHSSISVHCIVYGFIGNLSNTVGAFLANQLTIQIFTGIYMAAADLVNFICFFFPFCKWKSARQGSGKKRRNSRKRNSLFVFLLPLSVGSGYWTWQSISRPNVLQTKDSRRRLLSTFLQENTDVIGYALGLVALTISWTSKCPDIQKMYNGKKFSNTQVWSQIFKIIASVIYASAILCHDRQTDYILKALPWILNSLGTAAIDNTILLLNYLRVTKVAHHIGLDQVLEEEQDTQVLLSPVYQDMAEIEEEIQLETTEKMKSEWVPLTTIPNNRYLQKMAEIGHYMDLSIQTVQEISFGMIRLQGEGWYSPGECFHSVDNSKTLEPPSYPPLKVISVELSSSVASSDAISLNSELEQKYMEALNSEQWDFEDMDQNWNKGLNADPEDVNKEASIHQDLFREPQTDTARQPISDFWYYEGRVMMTDERASAILADYEEEIRRTGK
ncbi:transmembrane protein 44 isoform X1 [Erpetoichthys calabaricus]|uniref:transmembrane protein 44 isoform X1 n=2 Tax=Erpetoichthys calabaricus TaxID=27687 RepID=UPI00109EEAB1|nr:transmembrane protein 44 isoform X1 [Erpetoichthys calabaricus]